MPYRKNWGDRWFDLTGRKPDPSLVTSKKYYYGRRILDDALRIKSQRFRRRKPE